MIGFRDDGVYVSFSNGRSTMEPSVKLYAGMGVSAGGWSSFNTYPRFVGDVDGDGTIFLFYIKINIIKLY